MQVVDHIEGDEQPVRARPKRAARASQLARLWALSEVSDAERDALRARLLGLEVDAPAGDLDDTP